MDIAIALTKLFDFQRFEGNEKLQAVIDETENRRLHNLTDDELEWVSAAGEDSPKEKENGNE